ncbi:MAG TPA: YgcG family protein, partial [Thermodesulfovibrionia bacterium]|nr:YgcG family protein [Thermodesulfovibrionia bacterium]
MNKIVIVTVLCLFFVQPCFAKTDVPYLQGRVNDYAKILSDSAAKQLEKQLQTYETETTNQLVVLTVDSLNGQDIESYASDVFSAWKPGLAGKDNGVLLVVAVKDRKMRIEVGYGLEGSITDTKSGLVIRNAIAPYFKQGNFDRGITAGVGALMELGRGIEPTSAVSSEKPGGGHSFWFIAVLVMPFVIIVFMALLIIKKYLRSRPRVSKKTGMAMKKLDETADDAYLSKGQQYEEAIGSVDYDVWVTEEGDDVQIIPHKKWFTKYTSCPKCLFKTYYQKNDVTL